MRLTLFLFSILHMFTSLSQLKLQSKEAPAQMETLQFLVGKWTSTDGKWFDDKGNPMKVERDKNTPDIPNKKKPYEIAPIMGGLYLEGGASSDAVRAYFYYNEGEGEYYHLAIDFMGSTSIMTGDWNGKQLILTDIKPQKHPVKGTIMWRRVFYDINEDDYSFRYEYSRDEGKNWKLRGKQTMKRV